LNLRHINVIFSGINQELRKDSQDLLHGTLIDQNIKNDLPVLVEKKSTL
jgi:hypothetical protein